MLNRLQLSAQIKIALKRSRVVAVIGPRQCGKTTIARSFVNESSNNYFDLEDPVSLVRLSQPMTELQSLKKLIVIDEIQRRPELFPVIRVLADRKPLPARFLILGSSSPELLRQSSESLAGRIEYIELAPFSIEEVNIKKQALHWLRGGYPLSFLAKSNSDSFVWRKSFIQTFIERDIPQMGLGATTALLTRFWYMLAHYHGNIWNAAEPARSLGVNESTSRRYLDLLTGVFMVRQLKPWFANLKKRQVKSPKIYIRDSGLLHCLLNIHSQVEMRNHIKYGASYEGYVVEEIIRQIKHDEVYFWAVHSGAELDLLLIKGKKKLGFEIKRADAPVLTKSMQISFELLELDELTIIYPGDKTYSLAKCITVKPFNEVISDDNVR